MMGLFDFLKKKNANSKNEEEIDQNAMVIDTFSAIDEKCEYGDAMEKLNEHERLFYITQTLEQEVNNGGFSQYFYNSSGNFANEMVDAFTRIGALKTAEICKKAVAVFNGQVPVDRDERENLLESLDCEDIFDECDNAFYDYEDDLEALNYAYVMKHRKFFVN
ncbi:MAG: DMP19 family protein [Clostridia bacterium]|nr:DMP19 family protein [Clostridia bacterium]